MPNIFGNNIPLPGQILNEMFPIQAKGAVSRLTLPGVPSIESEYHKAMEQGRKLESSIGDAMFQIQAKKLDIQEKITAYMDMNSLAIDGQLRHTPRKFKFAADSLHFLQVVHKYTQDITDLIQALTQSISLLTAIEANMLAMIQSNINALSNLLGEICNWGLPNLASIPNLFNGAGASIWQWNGFAFLPLNPLQIGGMLIAGFKPPTISIPTFGFSQCIMLAENLNIFGSQPAQVSQGANTVGTALFMPPLGGTVAPPDPTPANIAALTANTTVPAYNPETFNPNTSMIGSLPDPSTIISAYQLPADTFESNIISLNPNLVSVVIEPSDPDYSTTPNPQRAINLRQLSIRFLTLDNVVSSNFEPILTATWLFYLSVTRAGRSGQWLANMEAAYENLVKPSVVALQANPVPYNNLLGGPGVVDTPTVPLIQTLQSATAAGKENMLWMLSYIESGLLGYTRSKNYDDGADTTFLSGFTGSNVDYVPTTFDATDTQAVTLGEGTASFPTVAQVPKALIDTFNAAVALAATNIAGAPNYQTTLTRFKFVYDPFAVAQQVDRFTQFWRTFNFNFQTLLSGDPYIVNQIVTYTAALDSAIDPLAAPDIANQIKADANSRVRTWVPGTPLLNIPKAPIVLFQNPGGEILNTGWSGTTFNPASFLARPDIQSLPIPTQTAMLRTNLSYAAILTVKSDLQKTVQTLNSQASGSIQNFQNAGFHVLVSTPVGVSSDGSTAIPFQTTDYDFSGNVTSPTLFTIQKAGTYAISGSIFWGSGGAGVRTTSLLLNGMIVLDTTSTSSSAVGPITQTFSAVQILAEGDTLQVITGNLLPTTQDVVEGSELYVSVVPSAYVSPPFTDTDQGGGDPDSEARQITAAVNLAAAVAVQIDSNGNVTPVDPVGAIAPAAPFVDGVTTDPAVAGALANVGTNYGSEYTIAGTSFTVGGLVYAGPNGVLTQDYSTLITEVNWVVVVGKASSPSILLLQPQLPQRVVGSF